MWDFIQRVLNIWAKHDAEHVLCRRIIFTTAQVNAGATLVQAIPNHKIAMTDAYVIAIGGAAGAVTTVDILATLASVSRKLVAFAQANLTQSTRVLAGGTGGTTLADGASTSFNDVGTPITVGITGSAVTTATGFVFIIYYRLEKL